LAKAQAELINPEKSLTATIRPGRPGEVERRFLPRMADFALWTTACETAVWRAGTFTQAFQANRRARSRT
jgi:hypothetical protein